MPVTNFFAHIAAIPFEGCLNITVINSVLAQMGCSLPWQLLRQGLTLGGIFFEFGKFLKPTVSGWLIMPYPVAKTISHK